VRFTFPAGARLLPDQRAVVFGGGQPTGSFGGAEVFALPTGSGLSLTDAPSPAITVSLESAATGGVVLDTMSYDALTFSASCTTTCPSRTRTASGTGFVTHLTAPGAGGALSSPGTAPTGAIPKLAGAFSTPREGESGVSLVVRPVLQFNLPMATSEFSPALVSLYASGCALPESPLLAQVSTGTDATSALVTPTVPLLYGRTYCLVVDALLHSAAGTALGSAQTLEFTTRAAVSSPSATVVLSQIGGKRLASTGTGPNDEFVELFNPTASPVNVGGWHLQRRTASGTADCWATLPVGTTLAPRAYLLVAGAGYSPSSYAGITADVVAAGVGTGVGTALSGTNESVALLSSAAATCTSFTTGVVDVVSLGTITDTAAALQLPPAPTLVPSGGVSTDATGSLVRKACFDSTADAHPSTGLLSGGGQAARGSAERSGVSLVDWVRLSTALPRNSLVTATGSCLQ
jgi:hypothetical protein